MQEPLESYCHIGLIHPMAFPETLTGEGPILETFEKIAVDPFFSAVEVTQMKDPAVRKGAAEMLEACGLDVIFSAVPPLLQGKLSLCAIDAAARKQAVDLGRTDGRPGLRVGRQHLDRGKRTRPGRGRPRRRGERVHRLAP